MLKWLFPKLYVKSIYNIPYDTLYKRGIRFIAFDIDNTTTPFDVKYPDNRVIGLFSKLKKRGFKICLISNNSKERVLRYNERLNIMAIYKGGKPIPTKLLKAIKKSGFKPREAAMVGDQVFTDVLCGNLGGIYSILTRPICQRDQLITKVKRGLERQVIKIYLKERGR